MADTVVEESVGWRRNPGLVARIRERAEALAGAREEERLAALCRAWAVLDPPARRAVLAALGASAWESGRDVTDAELAQLELVVVPGACGTFRPDLALIVRRAKLVVVLAVIDAKTRSCALVNCPRLSTVFGVSEPHELPRDLVEKVRPGLVEEHGTWWIAQHLAYRCSPKWVPDRWDVSDARWVLLSPGAWYTGYYWTPADLERVMVCALDAAQSASQPQQALLVEALAAHVAGPGTFDYCATTRDAGRTTAYARLSYALATRAYHGDVVIGHRHRKTGIAMTWDGWRLTDEQGQPISIDDAPKGEIDAWKNDLLEVGDRPSWVACNYPGCGEEPCRHVDHAGNQQPDEAAA